MADRTEFEDMDTLKNFNKKDGERATNNQATVAAHRELRELLDRLQFSWFFRVFDHVAGVFRDHVAGVFREVIALNQPNSSSQHCCQPLGFKQEELCPFNKIAFATERVDHRRHVLAIGEHAVELVIPSGAIGYNDVIDIEISSSLNGQFIIPKGYRPISTFVWIKALYDLKKKLHLKIPHHAHVACKDDLSQLCVLKTCKSDKIQVMHEITEGYKYDTEDSFCIYSSDNFCSVCLASKSLDIPNRVRAYQILPEDYETLDKFTVEVLVCYDLPACKEKIVEQTRNDQKIIESSCRAPPAIKRDDEILLLPFAAKHGDWEAHPRIKTISEADLQFHKLENLDFLEKEGSYPPRFLISVSCIANSMLYLSYEIILRRRNKYNICNCKWLYTDYLFCGFTLYVPRQKKCVENVTLYETLLETKPNMTDIFEIVIPNISAHWQNIGYNLGFGLNLIETLEKQNPTDYKKCCENLFKSWLQGQGHTPITWSTLLNAIGRTEELRAAAEDIMIRLCLKVKVIIVTLWHKGCA